MNVYQALNVCARNELRIFFDPKRKEVTVQDQNAMTHIEVWHNETGVMTPTAALIRAVEKSKHL